MIELRPCPACKRHVAVREVSCPFCAAALPAARAQYSLPGRLTRAAIFSAALTACSDPKPAASPPQPGSAGSDDLEKLLDTDERTVERTAPSDAAIDAEAVAATPVDAGVVDAGPSADEIAKREQKQRRLEAIRRMRDQQKREQERIQQLEQEHMQHAKPYGAPPARRRIV